MPKRLDKERQNRLEPKRVDYCLRKLSNLDDVFVTYSDNTTICFEWEGNGMKEIKLYPYSGWWTGPKVGSGRGFNKLYQKLTA